jgi:two-component system nitrate/nitrite sensor histidine kinase NarX
MGTDGGLPNASYARRPQEEAEPFQALFDAAPDGLILNEVETGQVILANPAAWAMHRATRGEFVGSLPETFIHPDSQTTLKNYLQAFRSATLSETHILHFRRDGSTFHGEWRGTALPYRGRPCALSAVRDASQRIQADQTLQQRVEAHTREQAALLAISHTLASTLELQPGLILEQLQGIIEFGHATLFRLKDSTLSSLGVRGPQRLEQSGPFQVRLADPETHAVLYNGHRPTRIDDLVSGDPAAEVFRSLLERDAAELLEGVRAWLWVPLAVKGRLIGGLGIAHARPGYFTTHHSDLALSMADQVAITMVNAELVEHAQGLAALQERQRLAQNLHDAVNQSLFSAGLIAEVLPRLWEREPDEARRSLEDLRRLTRGALAEMRALLAELRPATLTDAELGDLLRLLGNAFTGRTNIPVAVTVHGEGSLPAETQVAVYRICQEALNNIAKHAKASQVEVTVRHSPDALELHLRDNGSGFVTSESTPSGHYGLGMMQERAETVGGVLTVSSQPGQGTEITLRWRAEESS